MKNSQEYFPYAIIGAVIGAVVFVLGLHLVKEFAEIILRINPIHAGVVGAFIGLCLGSLLWFREK